MQYAGIQGEHNATKLIFDFDGELLAKINGCRNSKKLFYRFDCFSSSGTAFYTESRCIEELPISLVLGENITRNGGRAEIYLVLTFLDEENKTETEFYNYPVKLRFDDVPGYTGEMEESRESITAMTEAAKNAAQTAETAAENAENAVKNGGEYIFDGGGAEQSFIVTAIVDGELSKTSGNAIANKAVAVKLSDMEAELEARSADITAAENSINTINYEMTNVTGDIDVLQSDASDLKDRIYIEESGTSGIWTYRKWSDGTAECWGRTTVDDVKMNKQWGVLYAADKSTNIISYPFIFAEKPIEQVTFHSLGGSGFVINTGNNINSSAQTSQYTVVRNSEQSNIGVTHYYDFYVTGRWK